MTGENIHKEVGFELEDTYKNKEGLYIVVAKVKGSLKGIFNIPAIHLVNKRKDLLYQFSVQDIITIIGHAALEQSPIVIQKKK